jgi:hypothetical protein
LLGDPEVTAEELDHRQQGYGFAVGYSVRLVDGNPACTAALGELVAEPALPGPGLGDHPHHLRVSRCRPLERRLEGGHLATAADESREAARVRRFQARPHPPHTLEIEDAQRLAQPLEPGLPKVSEREVAGNEACRILCEEHFPRLGDLLHPCREPYGMSLRRVIHAQVVSDPADDHLARIEAHADREVQTMLEPHLVRVAPKLPLEVQRRIAGTLCVVFVRDRRAEQRHDAVTSVLVDRALETVNSLGEDREEAIHDLVPLLGIDSLREIHRPLHVGEEHGDLLALALEGAAGS